MCLNDAHRKSCPFSEEAQQAAAFGIDNPFCEGGKDPKKSGADGTSAQAAMVLLFVYSIAVYFVS